MDPWRYSTEGMSVAQRLTPRGGRDDIDGIETLANGRSVLKVRVRAIAEGGEANRAVTELLAKVLGVPKARVKILSGVTSRLKQVAVDGDPKILGETLRKATAARNDREIAVTYQHILYDVSDKIATITLNRPDRMNAWTATMERDVRQAMEAASADDNVRVIVLTGAGRAFCAGADMEALKEINPNDIRRGENTPFDMNRRADWQTRYAYYPAIPKPVIGMLNGATAGIGLVHALYCDLRFAADNTVFTTAFARRGLIAEHGISWMLPRIVGHANALDLLMSARRVSSDEALRIGLVNRLYPPDQLREQTYAYARDLAEFVSPSAISVIKRQLYDVPFQSLAEATIDANREMQIALKGSDFREGVASFVEKRPPRFTGK